jgi:hypothetical protein
MRQHRDDLVLRQLGTEQNRALAFRKAVLAGPTPQHAPLPVLAVVIANG